MTTARDVSVIGVGMTRFGKFNDDNPTSMGAEAVTEAIADSGIAYEDVDAMFCGNVYGGMLLGQRIARDTGLAGVPVQNVENACSSSSTALHEAWVAIRAGVYDVVVVVGTEQLSILEGGTLPLVDEDHEIQMGMTMPALYAMRARRYMHDYGVSIEDLARVVVKNRANGSLNDKAYLRKPCSVEDVLASRPVADPFTLYHCCASDDGAAAVVVCAEDRSRSYTSTPIRILASTLTSGKYMSGFRDMTTPEITVRCAAKAYEVAGVEPSDIDVVEVHDAFSIAEILYYEALGLCEPGDGISLLIDGRTEITGSIPVNPSGGLLARGHPIGATGAAQVVELVWQLRGDAGERQTADPRMALAHCTGGGISGYDHGACTIHILAK